jgi:hypothetical protein
MAGHGISIPRAGLATMDRSIDHLINARAGMISGYLPQPKLEGDRQYK